MVVCVNPNPTVERTAIVDELIVGGVNRIAESMVNAGGKGATVARALGRLGHPSICLGPLGGDTGKYLVRLAEAESLPAEWTWVEGETRTNMTIVSTEREGADTIVNETGPTLTTDEWDQLCASIDARVEAGTPVSISGSTPPGVTGPQLAALVENLREQGAVVYVDSHGMSLAAMIVSRPFCVKVNDEEASRLLDRPLTTEQSLLQAAQQLSDRVDGFAILTQGEHGTAVADSNGLLAHVLPPKINFVSGVGSGDSFLAGLIAGVHFLDFSTIDAVRYASAAGALNAESMTQGQLDPVAVLDAMTNTEVQLIEAPVTS